VALGPEHGTLAGTRQTHHEFPPDPQLLMCGGRRVACDSHRLAADTAASTEGAKVETVIGFSSSEKPIRRLQLITNH